MSAYLDEYFSDDLCDKIFDYLSSSGYHLSISNDVFHLFWSGEDFDIAFTFRNSKSFLNWFENYFDGDT